MTAITPEQAKANATAAAADKAAAADAKAAKVAAAKEAKAKAAAEKKAIAEKAKAAKAAEAAQKKEQAAKAKAEKAEKLAAEKAEKAKAAEEAKAAKEKAKEDAKKAREQKAADRLKAKEEAAKAREAAKMPTQNEIRKPKPGTTTGRVWSVCDALLETNGRTPTRAEILTELEKDVNRHTITTQYAFWRKFHGISGRVVAPEDPTPAKTATPEEAAAAKEAK